MQFVQTIGAIFVGWTTGVAAFIVGALERVVSPRVVRLVERATGEFAVEAPGRAGAPAAVTFTNGVLSAPQLGPVLKGSRVEIVLQAQRFLFRPLELPARAADFLDGIVRAQIDRLTPWSASEAVFGYSAPVAAGADSIAIVVAATTRKTALTFAEGVSAFHPVEVAILAEDTQGPAGRVTVFERKARGFLDATRLRKVLLVVLAAIATMAIVAVASATYIAESLRAQESEISRQIAQRRAAFRAEDGQDRSPLATLERRKHETTSSVLVLDALAEVLPDHTYVTELHLQGNKFQIVGVTRDAPSLISLIELSPRFTRATFYAPTTRSPADPGERFHIEAQIRSGEGRNP